MVIIETNCVGGIKFIIKQNPPDSILHRYFMSKRKTNFPFNVAFVILCCKSEPKALKPDCNVPLKNFIALLICDDPLQADTLALLSAACDSSSRVAVCT